jgi:predicted SAM-dependent methyltransferase
MPTVSEETRADSEVHAVRGAGNRPALLHLGCGKNVHSAFVNVDLVAAPGVVVHDLRRGIPFPDVSFDLVYHSTMLSHLPLPDALDVMRDCHRVLKPGGVLRVVTEDLEQMCRVYLEKVESAYAGDPQSGHDHEWMMLELYDQATREYPGGRMRDYLRQEVVPNEAFITRRFGEQGRGMIAAARAQLRAEVASPKPRRSFLIALREAVRRRVLTTLLGETGVKAVEVGRFRLSSGQVSYRMYDRFSLRQLFSAAGFTNIFLRTARESAYPSWDHVNLDLNNDGTIARPHALIMEGMRPSGGSV